MRQFINRMWVPQHFRLFYATEFTKQISFYFSNTVVGVSEVVLVLVDRHAKCDSLSSYRQIMNIIHRYIVLYDVHIFNLRAFVWAEWLVCRSRLVLKFVIKLKQHLNETEISKRFPPSVLIWSIEVTFQEFSDLLERNYSTMRNQTPNIPYKTDGRSVKTESGLTEHNIYYGVIHERT